MMHTSDMRGTPVLTVRALLDGWSAEAEAQLWDELVHWCEAQQLFAGGSLETCVIYTLDVSKLRRRSTLLRNLLLSRLDAQSFSLAISEVLQLTTPKMRLAALEAISCAQQSLFERALESTQALATISISALVHPQARVSADGKRLDVTLGRQALVISLERLDGQPEPRFERYRGGIRAGELHRLIFGAAPLDWKPIPPIADLWSGDWTAVSQEWRIHVHTTREDPAPSHLGVMQRLMYVAGYE